MAPVSEAADQARRTGPPGLPEAVAVRSAEEVRRRRVWLAVAVAGINLLGFSGLVAEQATEWNTTWEPAALAWWVGGVTVVTGGLLVAAVAVIARWVPWPWLRITLAVLLAAVQALVRAQVLLSATTAPPGAGPERLAIWTTGMIGFCVALGAGFLVTALLAREDRERARRIAEEVRARTAVHELEAEELRVRRMVADRLHGTVQHRLVAIAGGLDGVAADLDGVAAERWAGALQDWAEELDELREADVRALSHSLFPSGADLGTYAAIRVLLDRLPTSVATEVVLGPRMRRLVEAHRAPLPLLDRLVVVYTVEEAVTNALKHGGASAVTVQVEVAPEANGQWVLDAIIDDDGSGPQSTDPELSGLARHRSRAQNRGGSLTLGRNDAGGGRLHLVLPFTPEQDLD